MAHTSPRTVGVALVFYWLLIGRLQAEVFDVVLDWTKLLPATPIIRASLVIYIAPEKGSQRI